MTQGDSRWHATFLAGLLPCQVLQGVQASTVL